MLLKVEHTNYPVKLFTSGPVVKMSTVKIFPFKSIIKTHKRALLCVAIFYLETFCLICFISTLGGINVTMFNVCFIRFWGSGPISSRLFMNLPMNITGCDLWIFIIIWKMTALQSLSHKWTTVEYHRVLYKSFTLVFFFTIMFIHPLLFPHMDFIDSFHFSFLFISLTIYLSVGTSMHAPFCNG